MSGNFLGMSDEEFLKQEIPPDTASSSGSTGSEDTTQNQNQGEESQNADENPNTNATSVAEEVTSEPEQTEEGATATDEGSAEGEASENTQTADQTETQNTQSQNVVDEPGKTQEQNTNVGPKGDDKAIETKPAAPDYESFYKQVMTPFKANGKMIQLNDPSEAIKLMQMGSNYVQKMQAIAPVRKLGMMLENNGIDEAKLSYLIDLDKKNPEAIKKLIKDAGIDPMDLDTSSEPDYRAGNHQVSDAEVNFQTAIEEVKSLPQGLETLTVIHSDWDQASKEVLFQNPQTLSTIHQQRENGIYDRIATEMNRQKTLGMLPANTPFLEAYRIVGNQIQQANGFADLVPQNISTSTSQPIKPTQATPVATRTFVPKPIVSNSEKVKAAATTRTVPKKTQEFVNPLAMSDADFEKQFAQFAGRV